MLPLGPAATQVGRRNWLLASPRAPHWVRRGFSPGSTCARGWCPNTPTRAAADRHPRRGSRCQRRPSPPPASISPACIRTLPRSCANARSPRHGTRHRITEADPFRERGHERQPHMRRDQVPRPPPPATRPRWYRSSRKALLASLDRASQHESSQARRAFPRTRPRQLTRTLKRSGLALPALSVSHYWEFDEED